uniref:C2H2-type domain-containing protein n=1 Tax=Panagrolaimus sp. PS1159 TaxID=55785 RepID=A0AC35GKW8_9BILA
MERIYSYSMDDSDSLDDRATSSSTLNSIYDINPLDDNDVFSPDLSLFDETSVWNPKVSGNEALKTNNSIESNNATAATSVNNGSKIIRITEPSNTILQPIILQPESKIIKMTVVSSATPVDMPVLTREAPFRPEQLSASSLASRRTMFASCASSSSSRPYQIFECPKCQKHLPSKHALAKHLHIHDPPRYKCAQC